MYRIIAQASIHIKSIRSQVFHANEPLYTYIPRHSSIYVRDYVAVNEKKNP